MRNSLIPITFFAVVLPCLAQVPEDSDNSGNTGEAPRALPVSPGAAQDAEAEREKLLKAADQIDMIQGNAETTKVEVDGMKTDIAQLQASNADLKQQLAQLQAALDKAEADRAKERQALVDEVAQIIATHGGDVDHTAPHHHAKVEGDGGSGPNRQVLGDDAAPPEKPAPDTEVHHVREDSTPATHQAEDLAPPPDPAPAPHPRKGYYYVVESGDTLTMICQAYQDKGVNVTVADVRKANGLSRKSELKSGQKLFIPKPGT